MNPTPAVGRGLPHPLGARPVDGGANFSVWARTATAVDLLFFDDPEQVEPSRTLRLDPAVNRTFSYWHVAVPDVRPGQLYAWRVDGPHDASRGLRHDPSATLLDPYGRALAIPRGYRRPPPGGRVSGPTPKSVLADLRRYDWEGDSPPARPFAQTVVYEMHVRGFTASPTSGLPPEIAGTYAGVVAKIPYLRSLGITAVELMPVQAFDAQDAPPGLTNYWGYSPLSFFAPHPSYAAAQAPLGVLDEFRTMVKELHRAGIEVILDVVFNHTSEAGADGPTLGWRGFDNEAYYMLDPADPARYADYSGCGNTLNANHSVVRRLIVDALHSWVADLHVDGFRFDLASILSRDSAGRPMADPPILWEIESDPVLAGSKLIAEAWDAGGLYQVGSFVGERWREWNGLFRDDVRRFVRGDRGSVARIPDRLLASPDLFGQRPAEVEHSINFVTCHDGFTLNDLVTYSRKHNSANLENGRDGSNAEYSWNCGVEGPTDDLAVERLRNRQVKNLLAFAVLSMGVPMLAMGDEVRRTQAGNDNAYCQDNAVSWFDWTLLDKHCDVLRFVRGLVALRAAFDMTRISHGLPLRDFLTQSRVQFHGTTLHRPDWSEHSHTLSLTVRSVVGSRMVHALLNAWTRPLEFELPPTDPALPWRRYVDTALDPPHDVAVDGVEPPVVDEGRYLVGPRSLVFLMAPLRRPGAPAPTGAQGPADSGQ